MSSRSVRLPVRHLFSTRVQSDLDTFPPYHLSLSTLPIPQALLLPLRDPPSARTHPGLGREYHWDPRETDLFISDERVFRMRRPSTRSKTVERLLPPFQGAAHLGTRVQAALVRPVQVDVSMHEPELKAGQSRGRAGEAGAEGSRADQRGIRKVSSVSGPSWAECRMRERGMRWCR
jgi:hypothetical protein